MIYSIHHNLNWLKGGLEYAQVYRAKILRRLGLDAKFIFYEMFPADNIQHVMEEIGFQDSEIIWLNTVFTDCRISPITYTLEQMENALGDKKYIVSRKGTVIKYTFPEKNIYYNAYLENDTGDRVHRVELISNGCLIRRDYYTYCRIYSEYFAPLNGYAHLYQRRFFNEDGSVAFEEIIDSQNVMYKFPDRILYSRDELVEYMLSSLKLTESDIVLIDSGASKIDLAGIIRGISLAKIGFIIHSNHFIEYRADSDWVRWNPYYEYALSHPGQIDFFVMSTEAQSSLLKSQFLRYLNAAPRIMTVPVGGLDRLRYPKTLRKKCSLITASRLSEEKHIDWVIDAVAEARKVLPELTLDIYGKGYEGENLRDQIDRLHCNGYVRLCGHKNLDEVYQDYEAYISGSIGETFGLTLMEAIGSGLPIIGFDVRYGNQIFIDEEKNGYKIPWKPTMKRRECIQGLTNCIIRLFTEANLVSFQKHSYEKSKAYLTGEVEKKWRDILSRM
jgi:poly(glycerol-phosphate) alpha-glucosyltransferase